MFPSGPGRHIADRPFREIKERLLGALARHIACQRRPLRLEADLVDLTDAVLARFIS